MIELVPNEATQPRPRSTAVAAQRPDTFAQAEERVTDLVQGDRELTERRRREAQIEAERVLFLRD